MSSLQAQEQVDWAVIGCAGECWPADKVPLGCLPGAAQRLSRPRCPCRRHSGAGPGSLRLHRALAAPRRQGPDTRIFLAAVARPRGPQPAVSRLGGERAQRQHPSAAFATTWRLGSRRDATGGVPVHSPAPTLSCSATPALPQVSQLLRVSILWGANSVVLPQSITSWTGAGWMCRCVAPASLHACMQNASLRFCRAPRPSCPPACLGFLCPSAAGST